MKNVKIFPKIELLVLVLILFAVVSSLTFEEKKQTLNGDWFVNMHATSGTYDGTTEAQGWLSIDAINWANISSGDRLFIISGNGTDYTPTNPISPTLDGITIIGIDGTNYGPTAYNINWNCLGFSKTRISHSSDHVVEINSTVCDFTAENIIFDNTSSTSFKQTLFFGNTTDITLTDCEAYCDDFHAVTFSVVDDIEMSNCICTSNEYVGLVIATVSGGDVSECEVTSSEHSALSIYNSDYVIISKCSFETYDTANRMLIEVRYSENIEISDCTTDILTGGTVSSVIDIFESQFSSFSRNKFHSVNVGVSCNYGINVHSSCSDLDFDHNSIFGTFTDSAVYDNYDNGENIGWTSNTINNASTGDGYTGSRASGCSLSVFMNNLITVDGSSNYAIKIEQTPSDWQPTYRSFDYNCYYNNNVSGDFGYWNGCGATNDMINDWQTGTWTGDEEWSWNCDPNLAADGYHLTSSSSINVLYNGYDFNASNEDIDNYDLPPSGAGVFSIGCDQATVLWYSSPNWNPPMGLDLGTWATPPPYPSTTMSVECYGGASVTVTNIQLSGIQAAYYYFTPAFTSSFTVSYGTPYSMTVGIVTGTGSGTYNIATLDITYTGLISTQDKIALACQIA